MLNIWRKHYGIMHEEVLTMFQCNLGKGLKFKSILELVSFKS